MPDNSEPSPSVGRTVHFLSYGSPIAADGSQKFKPLCRAAIITSTWRLEDEPVEGVVDPLMMVGLAVLNPTGLFFDENVEFDATAHLGGTWHWPERVGE